MLRIKVEKKNYYLCISKNDLLAIKMPIDNVKKQFNKFNKNIKKDGDPNRDIILKYKNRDGLYVYNFRIKIFQFDKLKNEIFSM